MPGVVVYAYHTDVKGLYTPSGAQRPPRLQGWARTDPGRTLRVPDHPSRALSRQRPARTRALLPVRRGLSGRRRRRSCSSRTIPRWAETLSPARAGRAASVECGPSRSYADPRLALHLRHEAAPVGLSEQRVGAPLRQGVRSGHLHSSAAPRWRTNRISSDYERAVGSEEHLGFVLIVPPAAEGDVLHGGRPLPGVGLDVMELQVPALCAPPALRRLECALGAVPAPHRAPRLMRYVTGRGSPDGVIRRGTDRRLLGWRFLLWPRPARSPAWPSRAAPPASSGRDRRSRRGRLPGSPGRGAPARGGAGHVSPGRS